MKKVLLICILLCFTFNIEAKDHVYKTKLLGDFVFNDLTNKITFNGKNYSLYNYETTEDGFKMFCLLDSKRRLFELYTSETGAYLVEYYDRSNKVQSEKKSIGATLYYEGVGEISADAIASNIARNKEMYLDDTGIDNSNDRIEIMKRVSDAIRLIKKGNVRLSSTGTYSFNDPEFSHLASTGKFNKKIWGSNKKDDNYYNNLAFSIISKAINDESYNLNNSSSSYTPEELQRIKDANDGTIDWGQVYKTEVVSYDIK